MSKEKIYIDVEGLNGATIAALQDILFLVTGKCENLLDINARKNLAICKWRIK